MYKRWKQGWVTREEDADAAQGAQLGLNKPKPTRGWTQQEGGWEPSAWTENGLKGRARRVVISSTRSRWRLVSGGVPQRSILRPVLFHIFINDWDDGAGWTLSRFAADTQLGGVVDAPEGRAAVQRNLNRLERWVSRNLMGFNKGKCHVLRQGRNNARHRDVLGATQQLIRGGLGSLGGHQGDREPTQEQVARRGCRVSGLGGTQNSTGGGPGQPAAAEPALGRAPASPRTLLQLETSF